MRIATLCLLCLACACGGGGAVPAAAADAGGSTLTAQSLLETCVSTDLNDFSGLLETLLNLFDTQAGTPMPEIDLISGLLSGGIVPWTLDADGDNQADISGTIFFTDPAGKVTIPLDLNDLLKNGIPTDPLDLLRNIPDGVDLNLTYRFADLPQQSGNAASGSGEFTSGFVGGAPTSASGQASLTSGDCTFDFDFAEIGVETVSEGGFPKATAGFELLSGPDRVKGSVTFDGTSIAVFKASLDGQPEEIVRFDLEKGSVVGNR